MMEALMKKKVLPIVIILLLMILMVIGGCRPKQIPIDRIAMTSFPKVDYLKGETLDLDGAMVTVYYSNKTSSTFPLKLEMVSEYNPQEIGEHKLVVKYENVFTNITITISNAPIINIEPIAGILPYKTEYIEDEDLDLTHLRLKINYESGDPDIIDVTEDMVSGYDDQKLGKQDILIRYLSKYTVTYPITVREKRVKNISINEIPDKKLYLINERIDFESLVGGKLHIAYDNGFTTVKNFEDLFETQEEIDNAFIYDTSEPANKEVVSLSYGGKEVIFEIKVLIKEAVNIELIRGPSGPQVVGTDLSLRGGLIYIEYNNETSAELYMTDEKITSSGYQRNLVGQQSIKLAFEDIRNTFTFEIEVIEATPIELILLLPVTEDGQIKKYSEADDKSNQARFYQEGTINLDIWEFVLRSNNDTYSQIYPLYHDMLLGGSEQLYLDSAGERTYSFRYIGENIELNTSVTIPIIEKRVVDIIVTPPTNNIFYRTEELVLSGAEYTVRFNDGTQINGAITRDMISGYNNSIVGNQNVTVTYNNEHYGKAVGSFQIKIIRKAFEIRFSSIYRSTYILGEEFDMAGLVMLIHYEGEANSESVSEFGAEWSFINTLFDELGQQEVIVEYQAVGLTLTTTIPITVKNDVVAIQLTALQEQEYIYIDCLPEVVAGLHIDLTDIYLECTFENGEKVFIPLTAEMLDYKRSNKQAGVRNVNISYFGININTTVNVKEKEIASLELIQQPQKKYYKAMEEATFDAEELTLKLNYTNNTSIILSDNNIYFQDHNSLTYRIISEDNTIEDYITLEITPLDTNLDAGIEFAIRTLDITISEFSVSFDLIIAYKIATDITWDISEEGEGQLSQPEITALQGLDNINFPQGASFKVVFNDGEFSEIIDIDESLVDIEIIGFDYTKSGVQTIHLRYQDVLLSTIIKVRAKDLFSIEFVPGYDSVPNVTEGMPLDLRNVKIAVTYYHDLGEENYVYLPPTIMSLSSSMINYDRYSGVLGPRVVTVTFKYTGNITVTKNLYFNVTVVKKKLANIGMGTIPKTKYIELDTFSYENGTIILYYDNQTTEIVSLSHPDLNRIRDDQQIRPEDYFILDFRQFNNEDFSGFSRRQQIFITYKADDVTCTTSYDIIMHDRLYIQIDFTEMNEYNPTSKIYYFWYGEEHDITYRLLGYSAHTDIPDEDDLAELNLIEGIHYTFKYINDQTGEEFDKWPKDAGTYTIYMSYNANATVNNDRIHNSFVYDSRKVIIRPKNIHIQVNNKTKIYGENNPQFSIDIFAVEYRENSSGGQDIIYHIERVFGYDENISCLGEIAYSCKDNSQQQVHKKSPVGDYIIDIIIAPHRNYSITVEQAIFKIEKRKIIIIAQPHEKEYGQVDPLFTYTTASVLGDDKSGHIAGDTFSGYLLRPSSGSNNGVGVYDIVLGNLNNNNYTIEFVPNTLTITQRPLTLTAKSYTKIYGENMPYFEVIASSLEHDSPFAYNDSLNSLGGKAIFDCVDNYGNSVNIATAVGTYSILLSGYNSNNYAIEFVDGTISIIKREVNVYAQDAQKIYGEADGNYIYITTPVPSSVDTSGVYADDTLIGNLSREIGENVGEYQILQGTLNNDNNPNYNIHYHFATFTILIRDAQIEIINLSCEYNGQLPQLSHDDYVLHNAHGDIKDNIILDFISPSMNRGSYKVTVENIDSNHNLSFLESEYIFTIIPKTVSASFFNIPYGALENGQYTGSVYKGSAYNYEARVNECEVCLGDTVNVSIETAEVIGDTDLMYIERNTVTTVGVYSVRLLSLDNPNYVLRIPDTEELEELGDYRVTQFTIIPTELKIFVTVPDMSKRYNKGLEIVFSNSIVYDDTLGKYKTDDYIIITDIAFRPNITVYPYYLINAGEENQAELYPKNVLYEEDEFGNGTIKGYNIRAISHNNNYTALLVDQAGHPLELDGEEIVDEDYRLKITPLQLSFRIHNADAIKDFDGQEPELDLSRISITEINKEEHLKFRFDRIDNPFTPENIGYLPGDYATTYADYKTPNFMQGHLTNADCGIFFIVPYSTDPNYEVLLNESSIKIFIIRRLILYNLNIRELRKSYDGQFPTINHEQITTDNYIGEMSELSYRLSFANNEQNFYASNDGYEFSIRFNFPGNVTHDNDGYEHHLDFNHKFSDPNLLEGFRYQILKRNVYVSMVDGENASWKYYNGLNGALFYVDQSANTVSDETFRKGYIIEDEQGRLLLSNDGINISQLFKNNDAVLSLANNTAISPQTIGVNITTLSSNTFITTNFVIQKKEDAEFSFEIRRQIIEFYIDDMQRIYGEDFAKADYKYFVDDINRAKIVLPSGYGPDTNLFGEGKAIGNLDYIFQLSYILPYAGESYNNRIDHTASVGDYELNCDGLLHETLNNGETGFFAGTYYILVFKSDQPHYINITKRELAVSFVDQLENYYTVNRIYGYDISEVIFTYKHREGDRGLIEEDVIKIEQGQLTLIKPSFQLYGEALDKYTHAGIYNNVIEIDFYDKGTNDNYEFSFFDFYDNNEFMFVQPRLKIERDILDIQLVTAAGDNYTAAEYGSPPTRENYSFICTNSLGQEFDLFDDKFILSNIYAMMLPATEMKIDDEIISFDAVNIELDFSQQEFSLANILWADFNRKVVWDYGLQAPLSQLVMPELRYKGIIQRQATNGQTYSYEINELVYLKNYMENYLPIEYRVYKRAIKVSLHNLHEDSTGTDAVFNILWDEMPENINSQTVLLYLYGRYGYQEKGYTIVQNGKENLLLDNFDLDRIVHVIIEPYYIIVSLEGEEQAKLLFLDWHDIDYDPEDQEDIDAKFAALEEWQIEEVVEEYDFSQVDYEELYETLTITQIEQIYEELVDNAFIEYLYFSIDISTEIMEHNFNNQEIVTAILKPEEIIIRIEGKEYFLIELGKEYNSVEEAFALLTREEKDIVINNYIFDNQSYITVYATLSSEEKKKAHKRLCNLSDDAELPLQYIHYSLHDMVGEILTLDDYRLLFSYIFELEKLVYGDSIGIGDEHIINTQNISLKYNTTWGEGKAITAQGIISENYDFVYIPSTLNIYRYVVNIGVQNYLPNIMVKGTDTEEDFLIRLNYIDGNSENIKFKLPKEGLDYVIDYERILSYISSAINLNLLESNQSIKINYYEQFFGYKEFTVDSELFNVRVKDDVDELLWAKDKALSSGYTGGTFISSNGTKKIGDKIDSNYTYYLAETASSKGLYNFDMLNVKFRLEPRNQANYYFEIVLNGNSSGTNYLVLRISSGNVDKLDLIGVHNGIQEYYHTITKPADLDLFDGRTHEITAYIDKLGTRENDATGYKLLVVIDNGTYFNFTNLDKNYPPEDISVAGFQVNDCNAWISSFRVSTMGIKSSRAIKVLPDASAYMAQSYSITGDTKEINLTTLVRNFTFHSSSYIDANFATFFSYEFFIDGEAVSSTVNLPVGIYLLEAMIYYNNVLMDNIHMNISISNKFTYEFLQESSLRRPYMSQPLTYYGHTYSGAEDLETIQTREATISASNRKEYSYIKTVLNLDIAQRNGAYTYPDFNAAILLKSTNVNLDMRDPEVVNISGFYGVGIYIRTVETYPGYTEFFTRVYVRKEGTISYTSEINDIDWSAGRIVVEAVFDSQSKSITIYIKNDDGRYIIRLATGYRFETNDTITDSYNLNAIIDHPLATAAIKLKDSRMRIYQMESGYRKLYENNFYDYDSGEFIINTGSNVFNNGTRLFLDNANGLPMVSNYDTYNITIKGSPTTEATERDYFHLLVGTNLPYYDSINYNRGIYIGYRRIFQPGLDIYFKVLFFGVYKSTSNNVLRFYGPQFLGAALEDDETTSEMLGIPIIDDVLDGTNEYAITVKINRQVVEITNDEEVGYIFSSSPSSPVSVYLAQVFINGTFINNGYIPVMNNLSAWTPLTGSQSSDNATGAGYDTYFLSTNLYAGLEVINAEMIVKSFTVI